MLCVCKNELTVAEAACCAVKLSTGSGSQSSPSSSCFTVPTTLRVITQLADTVSITHGRLLVYRCVRTAVSILLVVQPNPALIPGI